MAAPGQPGYGQPQPQVGYAHPQTTVVIVNQTSPVLDYSFPRGKIPAIIVVVSAIVNIVLYVVFGTGRLRWVFADPIFAFIFYLAVGILGMLGERPTNSPGIAISTIILSSIALLVAIAQLVIRGILIYVDSYIQIVLLIFALVTFACLICLIVLASRVLCCKPPSRATTYQQGATQQEYSAHTTHSVQQTY